LISKNKNNIKHTTQKTNENYFLFPKEKIKSESLNTNKTLICSNKNCIHKGKPQFLRNFNKDASRKKRKYRSRCKDCEKISKNKRIKKYRKKNKIKRILKFFLPKEKIICHNKNCIHKGKPQSLENFRKDVTKKNGYRKQCKDCLSKKN